MGKAYEQTVEIDAAPDAVFDYVANFERHPEWASNPLEVSVTSSGPIGESSTFTSVGKLMGTHHDSNRVTEFDRPRRIGFVSEGDVGTVRNWFAFEDAGSGTRLTKGSQITRATTLFKLFSPLYPVLVPRGLAKDLRSIKARVEGGASRV